MTELFIAANVLMLACLAESVFGRNLLLRTADFGAFGRERRAAGVSLRHQRRP